MKTVAHCDLEVGQLIKGKINCGTGNVFYDEELTLIVKDIGMGLDGKSVIVETIEAREMEDEIFTYRGRKLIKIDKKLVTRKWKNWLKEESEYQLVSK